MKNVTMFYSCKMLAVGVWEQLDKEAESIAEKYGKVYIASGPVIQYPKHPRYAVCYAHMNKYREK